MAEHLHQTGISNTWQGSEIGPRSGQLSFREQCIESCNNFSCCANWIQTVMRYELFTCAPFVQRSKTLQSDKPDCFLLMLDMHWHVSLCELLFGLSSLSWMFTVDVWPCKLGRVSKSSGNQRSSFSRTRCTLNFCVSALLQFRFLLFPLFGLLFMCAFVSAFLSYCSRMYWALSDDIFCVCSNFSASFYYI